MHGLWKQMHGFSVPTVRGCTSLLKLIQLSPVVKSLTQLHNRRPMTFYLLPFHDEFLKTA